MMNQNSFSLPSETYDLAQLQGKSFLQEESHSFFRSEPDSAQIESQSLLFSFCKPSHNKESGVKGVAGGNPGAMGGMFGAAGERPMAEERQHPPCRPGAWVEAGGSFESDPDEKIEGLSALPCRKRFVFLSNATELLKRPTRIPPLRFKEFVLRRLKLESGLKKVHRCEFCEKFFSNASAKGGHVAKTHPGKSLKQKIKKEAKKRNKNNRHRNLILKNHSVLE